MFTMASKDKIFFEHLTSFITELFYVDKIIDFNIGILRSFWWSVYICSIVLKFCTHDKILNVVIYHQIDEILTIRTLLISLTKSAPPLQSPFNCVFLAMHLSHSIPSICVFLVSHGMVNTCLVWDIKMHISLYF